MRFVVFVAVGFSYSLVLTVRTVKYVGRRVKRVVTCKPREARR